MGVLGVKVDKDCFNADFVGPYIDARDTELDEFVHSGGDSLGEAIRS